MTFKNQFVDITENEPFEELDENFFQGLAGTGLGTAAFVAGAVSAAPITIMAGTALIALSVVEVVTAVDSTNVTDSNKKRFSADGVIVGGIKKYIQDYSDKKFAQGLTEENAAKVLADVEKRKSKLSGGQKGAVTRLQNALNRAFEKGDEKMIGKIIKKFIQDNN